MNQHRAGTLAPPCRLTQTVDPPTCAPASKRAVVIGAGSFGTAVADQTRTEEQAHQLRDDRENRVYFGGVELPRTTLLTRLFGASRTGCVGGPAHPREMVGATFGGARRNDIFTPNEGEPATLRAAPN